MNRPGDEPQFDATGRQPSDPPMQDIPYRVFDQDGKALDFTVGTVEYRNGVQVTGGAWGEETMDEEIEMCQTGQMEPLRAPAGGWFNIPFDAGLAPYSYRSPCPSRHRDRDRHRGCSNCGGQGWISRRRPRVVVLCGSTRFASEFQKANYLETMKGRIVLSIGVDTKSDSELDLDERTKALLDELHKRKIDLADEVLVLNKGGYIGESTRSEVEYARRLGRPIRWLEVPKKEDQV